MNRAVKAEDVAGTPFKNEPPVKRLLALMRLLRGPGGCPWDREQTLESLKPYLVEECYELLDAVESGHPEKIREELGDVLLQVVFQAAICEEQGWYSFEDVADTLSEKLIRRHPHVFGDTRVCGAREVLRNWEAIKRKEADKQGSEKAGRSALDGIPKALPALVKAEHIQARAARVGFDWEEAGPVWEKLDEELGELKEAVEAGTPADVQEEFGDVLFTLVNLGRFLSVHSEDALQRASEKFIRRFRAVEKKVHAQDRQLSECGLGALDAIWNSVKGEGPEAESGKPPETRE